MGSLVSAEQLPPDFDRWDEVLALIRRAFASMDGLIDPPSSAHRLTVENLRDKARQETGFAALKDGRIVGCVFVLERANDLYVGKLAVEPGFQGQGIGRQLMQAVEDLARDRGKPAIELQTRIELTGNHAALARLGFRETERTAHKGYDRPTSITMRKVIS
ncbi:MULTISPECIES: GNAT family N-acetyltransferase [unclassified Mesorhizobium]|uniref:GNAT family N-acetyltransferase n=1 Tax=unclassified Mesorhizobium TaxID=325217 RepID=UPI000FD46D57|nr:MULTISPECIES: GNAT family N-acetyltransferase [unclassified Mesorhizobium]RUV94744.1 GNAT family N-acetyltransferase [Mesorhizobium sp. M5C.F.Ca.IN.020.14.1.1]RUV29894.1 GNAT family N-acetyltransferase [Mesorhizobium sp. M5C.F.Ca.IN.020.32.2.1]RWD50270.1 MAG: GNAT family N-acetyltransferase [Mesorhizobium sp.]RWE62745.1 MAG: GNAT family N-acetyltransferase [Mesorhizobium sp.]RWE86741.1 MAG: GNAT family N-acetyltransferase [Mesorhizobium sp.]